MQETEDWQDEIIPIGDKLVLKSVNERLVDDMFALVQRNKSWLQKAMNWPQYVNSLEDTRKIVQSNCMLHHRGYAKMFFIYRDTEMVGVFSFNQIEPSNKTAYIGYWLDEAAQGQGIIAQALEAIIAKYSREGTLRRFVIKCITTNEASNQVARRNGFTHEGCLRQAEYLNGKFHDQHIYARIVE